MIDKTDECDCDEENNIFTDIQGRYPKGVPERFHEDARYSISTDGRVWDDKDGGKQVWPPEEVDDD